MYETANVNFLLQPGFGMLHHKNDEKHQIKYFCCAIRRSAYTQPEIVVYILIGSHVIS